MNDLKMFVRRNVDSKVAVSAALGMAAFGAVMWAAKKTGVKPVKQAAKVAQGGGK